MANISTCFCSTSTLTIINMHASAEHKDCLCLTVFMIPVLQPADYGNITRGAPFGCPIKCAKKKRIRMELVCPSSPQTLKTVEPPSIVYRYHKLSAIMHQINSPANYITLWTYTYSKYLDAMKPFLHHKRLHYSNTWPYTWQISLTIQQRSSGKWNRPAKQHIEGNEKWTALYWWSSKR